MPRVKTDNIRINLLISPKLLTAVKKLTKRRGGTYTEFITTACREYLVKELEKEKTLSGK